MLVVFAASICVGECLSSSKLACGLIAALQNRVS